VVAILLTVIGIVVIVFPIIWMVFASARPLQETLASPPVWLPRDVTFQFYYDLIFSGKYRNYLVNGYFIGLATTAFCLLLGTLGAYGFSRYRIKGGGTLLMGMVALRMVPGVALIIPYFRLAQTFGLFNTYLALILAHSSIALPFVVWLLKSYFDSIPRDLEEAAMVDGASRLGALYRVVLPLVAPGLVGTGVMAFLASWSELLLSVILTSGQKVAPLTVGVALFFTEYGRDWGHIMALNTLGVVPLMVIFVFLQRYVVQGITAGAVK
jgi:ABC-type glycerol-3-phosphate transport system permease component